MSARWKLFTVVMLLLITGGAIAFHKVSSLGVPFWQGQQINEWQIEARVSFLATGKKVKARLSLPALAADASKVQEAGSLGYFFNIEKNSDARTAVWAAENREQAQALYFRVRLPDGARSDADPVAGTLPLNEIEEPTLAGSLSEAATSIVQRVKSLSADPDSLFVAMFKEINGDDFSQEFVYLNRHYQKEFKGRANFAMGVDLLTLAGVPAHRAYGVRLDETAGSTPPIPLVEYYDGASWKVRDPAEPSSILDGRSLFVWHRGGGPLLDVTGGENSKVVFTVSKDRIPMSHLSDLSSSPFMISTILGLPIAERATFRYIVLIPLGAFVVVLMRNLVGVPTLGTFMPVLLALALLQIPLLRGLSMFALMVAVGLGFRFMLSRLNLLVVPRVAACVVIVTLLMIIMSVVSYRMGVSGGLQITLFPMIILAWTLERMSIIWEEEGKRSALIQVGGSVFVAVLAYFLMSIPQLKYWAFYFPELLLVLLAGILIIGRYNGYRLSELIRFKTFPHA